MEFLRKSLLMGSAGLALIAGAGLEVYADEVATDVHGEEAADAEEEIVVTASRLATPAEQIGSSVSVITADDMQRRQVHTVYDALRELEGVHIARQGGHGGTSSAFIRGNEGYHTKVMIDGIMVNDPSEPNRAFDFAHLTPDNIERVEVLRGNQSTLYGSDAIGGVINIITKEGEGPPSVTLSSEYGSFDTSISRFSIGGREGPLSYSLAGSYADSRGISHTDEPPGRDGYRNTTLGGKFGIQAMDNLKFDFTYRWDDAMNKYDASQFPLTPDFDTVRVPVDARAWTERHVMRSQATLDLADGMWEQIIGVGRSDTKRRNVEEGVEPVPDEHFGADESVRDYRGKYTQVDWQHNFYLHERSTLTLGGEWQEEKAPEADARTSMTGGFVQQRFEPVDDLFVTAGLRSDRHEDFGTETTYRFSTAYLLQETGTRFRGSFGTGFKAPSLDNLYGFAGNPDLEPERSRSWDLGVEQSFFDGRLSAEATYFASEVEDMIDWAWTGPDPWDGEMQNVDEARINGIETALAYMPVDFLTFRGGYTYTRTRDGDGEELLRRPKDRYTAGISYRWRELSNVSLTGHHVGRRYDWPGDVRLGSYTLFNLAASHDIHDNFTVFGRIENLTREDYEEVDGYNAPGRTFFAGLRATF